ncbi:MAG: MATE family efflux transporter [Spirochaetes bacterium]|nr:MATE family efflux transporter [Spirochaetota bacterium]MBU1080133.1 MATE family efflux transporter [Spirochaetota bacterium]
MTSDDRIFYRDLLRIAVPIALQNLIASSVNMLDTVMVGRLGAVELAAVGLGNQIWFLLMLLLFGISTGAGVFTAQYWGKRDVAGIRRTTGLSMALGLGAALAFMVAAMAFPRFILGLYSKDPEVVRIGAEYLRLAAPSFPFAAASFAFSLALRGVERVKLPLAATVVSLATNAILNYALIFGKFGAPALGVRGAAIATVLSRVIETAIVFLGAYARKMPPAGTLKEFRSWGSGFLSRFARIAAPVVVNEVLWSLGITSYNAILARVGTEAIAAYNVTSTVSQLAMVLFMGTANASAVMLGKRIGEGDRATAFAWARRFAIMAPLIGVATGALLIPASLALPWLFALGAEPLRQARLMILALAVIFPFKVFNLHVVIGICRSGGDTRFGAFFDIFGVWLFGVPLAALGAFVLRVEPWVVFALLSFDEVAKSGLGVWRLASKKWLNDVTV